MSLIFDVSRSNRHVPDRDRLPIGPPQFDRAHSPLPNRESLRACADGRRQFRIGNARSITGATCRVPRKGKAMVVRRAASICEFVELLGEFLRAPATPARMFLGRKRRGSSSTCFPIEHSLSKSRTSEAKKSTFDTHATCAAAASVSRRATIYIGRGVETGLTTPRSCSFPRRRNRLRPYRNYPIAKLRPFRAGGPIRYNRATASHHHRIPSCFG
jgi:hypothetical protein